MTKLACACREFIHRPDRFSRVLTWEYDENVLNTLRRVFGDELCPPIPEKEVSDFLESMIRVAYHYDLGQCPTCGRLVSSAHELDEFLPLTDLPATIDLEAEMCAHDYRHPSYVGLGTCRCGAEYSARRSGLIVSETGFDRVIREVRELLRGLPHVPQNVSLLASDIAEVSRRVAFGILLTCASCHAARAVSKDERLIISGLYCRDEPSL